MTFEWKSKSSKLTTRSNRRSRRGGYVLVLVALLLFGLMAMAALVIDIGYARLAQRQMQTATDAAALEGLRFRDIESDIQRRQRASAAVSDVFDDDLDATADARNFGAGPIVQFDNGAGDPSLEASQFMRIPDPSVYKPSLVSNFVQGQSDNSRGDMVAGNHAWDNPNPNYQPPIESPGINEYRDLNTGEYVGRFFTIPNANAPDPKNAFLVRVRRTEETLDGNVGTSGPALPYLFGRGSLVNRQLIGEGIKVRATSIASVEPVISVGGAGATMIGKLGIAISKDDWVQSTASPMFFEAPLGIVGEAIGATTSSLPSVAGYLSIYSPVANNRVVGFGYASVMNGTLTKLRFGTRTTQIAYENVSAAFTQAVSMPPAELETVFTERRLLKNQNQLLLAPVLVR